MRLYDHFLFLSKLRLFTSRLTAMSLSKHFPPSTQAILSAQQTPPTRKRTLPRDKSIIIISSSPELPQQVNSEDEEDVFPQKTRALPLRRRRRPSNEKSIEILEDDNEFSKLIGGFKYNSPLTLSDTVNIPRPVSNAMQKTSVEGFFHESKSTNKPVKSRVKTTLKTRVTVPSKPTLIRESPAPVNETQTSFFTTWAAAQAPTTRPVKVAGKPHRKQTNKKTNVEVILLSPRTGQKSAQKHIGEVERGRKLGEKNVCGGMWDACKRGLEGELYDCDGEVVFSQELRDTPQDISSKDVEICSVESVEEKEVTYEERPARRRGKEVERGGGKVLDDGMPQYSTFTTLQLQNEVKRYGFKALKSKPAMISLLEECWKASQQHPETPKTCVKEDISSPALLLRLQTRITQTIKYDDDQSMYCGILRYEPIVVEDLVNWLEERGVSVPELVVRGWCDKEGVCCVASDSLNAGRRARY